MHSGLSRKEFGDLFNSKENTVYKWECGNCVPMLSKLFAISQYFNVSIDSILTGKMFDNLDIPERSNLFDLSYTGQVITQINSLTNNQKERLLGYLDALS